MCLCAHGCRPGCYLRIYILSCHSGFVINLPAEEVVSVLFYVQALVLVNCVFECNCGKHARTFGAIIGDEGHQQFLKLLMAPTGNMNMYAICHTTAPD